VTQDALIALYIVLVPAAIPAIVMFILYLNDTCESCARAWRRHRKARHGGGVAPAGPPLEKIAEDLQRLGRARRDSVPGSMGYEIMTREYDKRLVEACAALGVPQRLGDFIDLDLAMERMRVEESLVAAGFVLAPVDVEQDVD
jgi:hypothetical protein